MKLNLYLDQINGRPLIPEVKAALLQALKLDGNPSSLHALGREAARALESARVKVAALIGASAQEVFFTASGTEANLWALTGLRTVSGQSRNHLVVSAVEHLSVLQTARRLEKEGRQVTVVPVDSYGRVDPDEVEKAVTPQTALVSVQWANGEVGTLQPVAELARRVKGRGVLFHTDAVAAAGMVPIDVRSAGVDALSLASGPLGGPGGVGALYVRKGVRILPLLLGGTQEGGRRAGTENLLGIIGMAEAASVAARQLPTLESTLTPLRNRLVRGILDHLPDAILNGHPTQRLPGHVSVSFSGTDAEALLLALDMKGIAVGLGSACSSQAMKVSHVLKAMGVEGPQALGTITITLNPGASEAEVDLTVERLRETLCMNLISQVTKGSNPA